MKRFSFKVLYVFATVFVLLSGCQNNQFVGNDIYIKYGDGTENVGAIIEKVSNSKIYFGHQSVGKNILSGIQHWEEKTGLNLKKVESKDFSSVKNIPLVHFRIGSNRDPHSKIDEFVKLVDQIPAEGNPLAFFKFCYVDINENTNVDLLFEYYKEKMLYLKETYPHISFVVWTVPVTGIQKGPKALVKKMLGREHTGRTDNVVRNHFNTRIHDELSGIFPVFDLAAIESSSPEGLPVTYSLKGSDYSCMPDYYTYDLGHLNDFGAKTLSYNLLAFLAEEFK